MIKRKGSCLDCNRRLRTFANRENTLKSLLQCAKTLNLLPQNLSSLYQRFSIFPILLSIFREPTHRQKHSGFEAA